MDLNIKIYDMKGIEPIEESSGGGEGTPPVVEPPATADYTGWVKQTPTLEELKTLPKNQILGQRELVKICPNEDNTGLYYCVFNEEKDYLLNRNIHFESLLPNSVDNSSVVMGGLLVCSNMDVFRGQVPESEIHTMLNYSGEKISLYFIDAKMQGFTYQGFLEMFAPYVNVEQTTITNPLDSQTYPVERMTMKPEYIDTIELDDRTIYHIKADEIKALFVDNPDMFSLLEWQNAFLGQPNFCLGHNAKSDELGGYSWKYTDIQWS